MKLFFVMLIFIPISIVTHYLHISEVVTFFLAALAIIPLAGIMGKATEDIAAKKGHTIGGLLNATFGNATELIIAFIALRNGFIDVVKASITGSIIGNLLLVMGASFLAGGLKYKTQCFNKCVVGNGSSMLFLAVIGLVVPAMFCYTTGVRATSNIAVRLSEWVSLALISIYFLGLFFSLHTHKNILRTPEDVDSDEEGEKGDWSMRFSIFVLFLTTILVALESEILVKSIEGVETALNFTELFVGVIIVAIIGNVAEHAAAIVMAMKNKADLSVNISQGSSIQVALFVAPVLVFFGIIIDKPMSLVFTPFEVLAVTISTIIAGIVAQDGESNWYEGTMLLAVYFILGVAFYFMPEQQEPITHSLIMARLA